LALLETLVVLSAGATGVRIAGPAIELIPPSIDFGTLPQHEVRRVHVTIRNSGSEMLYIRDVDSDCGCTVAQLADSLIAPGDTLGMEVTLSTRHFSGNIAKHVFLKTNDPGAPTARFRLKAFVRAMVLVRPSEVDFGDIPRGATPSQLIRITAAGEDSLQLGEIIIPPETFETQLRRGVASDSTLYELLIKVRPDAPLGVIAATARVATNVKNARQVVVTLKGQIHGFFKAEPERLILGQVRQGRSRQRSLRLIAQRPGKHQVLRASCTGESLNVQVKPIEEGRIYEITVTVPPSAPPGRIHGVLRIETDDPDQPELRIVAQGNVRRARAEGE
jgi:hypothetical protein